MAKLSPKQVISKLMEEDIDYLCRKLKDEFSGPADVYCTLSSKKRQLKRFCAPFENIPELFDWTCKKKRRYFFEILQSENCWEKANGVKYGKLNTQQAARTLIENDSSRDSLSLFSRYQIASWFCLHDQIKELFGQLMKLHAKDENFTKKKLAKSLVGRVGESDLMLEFWSYYFGDCFYKVKSEGRTDPWLVGLDYALAMPYKQLDAVKFFWLKMKSRSPSDADTERILSTAFSRLLHKIEDDEQLANATHIFDYLLSQMDYSIRIWLYYEDEVVHSFVFDLFENLLRECYFKSAMELCNLLQAEEEHDGSFGMEKWYKLMTRLGCKKCHEKKAIESLAKMLKYDCFERIRPKFEKAPVLPPVLLPF